ncbi:hypothetical protein [Arthrobacter castelli]|uniref:hypothetical protein n=1 Tax=Arthrobacter castelli TaxID=271431 RepID=UPI0004173B42|nr:hypothetical protein [Arthrobacter castelli]
MAGTQESAGGQNGLRAAPPDFDAAAATERELIDYGLPRRPDAYTRPGLAALWDERARRYQGFGHRRVDPDGVFPEVDQVTGTAAISRRWTCGYTLRSSVPFVTLLATWTIPNLMYVQSPRLPIDHFHTYVYLGFIDLHIEMTVNQSQEVICSPLLGLDISPGDVMSAVICMGAEPPGKATVLVANETSGETANSSRDTGYPPAVEIGAGVGRGHPDNPVSSLARFGIVYFDEISATTTDGARSLPDGEAITMVDSSGDTLAKPVRLRDWAFKTVYDAD